MLSLTAAVVTVSDTRNFENDTSGARVADQLRNAGHHVARRELLRDNLDELRLLFRELIADPTIELVISTGGTGITARDITPEALAPLMSKCLDGFGELFRALSFAQIGAATIQSRCVGALCDRTLVFALPGSTSAVTLAMEKILIPQLDSRTKPCNFAALLTRL
jgi:molybdenum cofactor biosynthesis protein B